MIRSIRRVAKRCGWAIGVHGSLKRDIDLIAAPWTADCVGSMDLLLTIAEKCYLWRGGHEDRPHGRQAHILIQPGAKQYGTFRNANFIPPQIDISIMCNLDKT